MSALAFYVYHLVMWPLSKRDDDGKLPKLGAHLLKNLILLRLLVHQLLPPAFYRELSVSLH